jgi:hypothetical protein
MSNHLQIVLWDPTPLAPWYQPPLDRIDIEPDKERALDQVDRIMRIVAIRYHHRCTQVRVLC